MPKAKTKTNAAAEAAPKTAKKTAVKKAAVKKVNKTCSVCDAPKAKLTRVIAKFDAGWGNLLFIRGLGGSLDWQKGVPLQNIGEDEWLWEQLVPGGTVAFKILVNDSVWSVGEDFSVAAGDTIIVRPVFQ